MTDQEFKNLLESEQVLYGRGAPSSAQGKELDLYIDTDTRKFYRKYLGSWTCNADLVLGPLFTTGNMSWDQLKVDASLAAFFEIVTESDGDRVFKLKQPSGGAGRNYYLSEKNGVAEWRDPAADFAAWLDSLKNKPNGVPGLDDKGHLDPGKVFPDGYKKDVAGGIPGLDGSGKLKKEQIPDLSNLYADKNAGNLDSGDVKSWQDKLGIGDDTLHTTKENGTGYTQLPNGLILQWGIATIEKMQEIGVAKEVTLPTAFPTKGVMALGVQKNVKAEKGSISILCDFIDKSKLSVVFDKGVNASLSVQYSAYWYALGF